MRPDTLEMILNIGESFFTTTEAKELLEMILSGAKQVCDADRATLFLADSPLEQEGKEILRSYAATTIGGQLREISVESGVGLVGYSYKTREALIINNVKDSPYFNPKIDELTQFKTQSILSIPLIDHLDKAFGVIQVLNKKSGGFSEDDLKKVKVLSLLAVCALRKIEDDKKMQNMKEQLEEYTKKEPAPSKNEQHLSLAPGSNEKKQDPIEEFFDSHFDMSQATKKFQKAYALRVITSCEGNKSQAAKDLKLSREGLRKILKRDAA